MIYEYRYKDGEEEYFDVAQSMKEEPLREHDGRPCFRVIRSANFAKKGVGWPGEEAKGAYTRLGVNEKNQIRVLK
jgi:predicted nucleic acid-binding Zn ribbon protein